MLFTKIPSYVHRFLVLFVIAGAVLVLIGWIGHSQDLVRLHPNFAPMSFGAAIGFLFLAKGFLLYTSGRERLARFSMGVVFFLGAITLLQNFLDLVHVLPAFESPLLNRMPVGHALSFMLLGGALFVYHRNYASRVMVVTTASLVIGFSLIGIINYINGFDSDYGWGSFAKIAAHASVAFLLLAVAVLWEMRLEMKREQSKPSAMVPFAVLLTGVLTTVVIWQLLVLRDQDRNRAVTQVRLEGIKASLENAFVPLEEVLEQMARRMAAGGYPREEIWRPDAEDHYERFKGLRRLAWADRDHILRWVYPLTGGGADHVGVRLGTRTTELNEYLRQIVALKQVSLSRVFALRDGRKAFFILVPVVKEKKFVGTIAAVLDVEHFFSRVLQQPGYNIEILEGNEVVFKKGHPEQSFVTEWTACGRFVTRGVIWDVRLTPSAAVIRENSSSLPGWVLLYGVTVSVLLGISVGFFIRARESEAEARKAFEWKEAGMNSMPLWIISIDDQAVVHELNTAAEKALGYKSRELAGKFSVMMFYPKADVDAFRRKMEEELRRSISTDGEFYRAMFELGYNKASEWSCIDRYGNKHEVIMSVSEARDDLGNVTGFWQILEDVTDLKAKEKLLKEQEVKIMASSRLASLGEMAAGVAHEINNPLAIINGHVGVLRRQLSQKGLGDDVELSKKMDAIESVVQRIARIIKGLKTYAREADPEDRQMVAVRALIEDTLSFSEEKFRAEGVELSTQIPSDLAVFVQSHQIAQVLLNLLNNAFDAVKESAEKRVTIEAQAKDDGVEISVSDTGPGVPFDLRTRIMEPFFTTKEVGKGVGLGLSISQGIIQGHGGKFYLDEFSARTRFVIWLPKGSKPNPL